MRAVFIGGVVDNSEVDLDGSQPPLHYPENTGTGRPRYRLHQRGEREDGSVVYAVYAAPELGDTEVERVFSERGYARRFGVDPAPVEH
ncbi:hypothetical protein [Xanthomonas theicola]|uniref:Uncharacterized protein n=1 Tax=Xanthomonas theicola TaxID=56464 RepID=A0A2S6ZI87_9XANT|nr:hypothetical protein [Xanthomonas theicola]PPT91879.1 hypothetical protein XthCFBP4691_06330 [Xanthomonas theicola]QNH23867.1 hypothetical protein G4Q83_02615 [Xanthomonas theicola]